MGLPLPRGAAGFAQAVDSGLQGPEFRAALHAAARMHGFSVERAGAHGVRTFVAWLLRSPRSQAVWVLEHKLVPITASTDHDPTSVLEIGCHIVDSTVMAETAEQSGWRLLGAAEAAEPVNGTVLGDLGEDELTQVRYWRPSCVGEVVFNHWD